MNKLLILAALAASTGTVPAYAVAIQGLYNTGVSDSGAKLANFGATDTHYALGGAERSATPTTYQNAAYVVANDAVFIASRPDGGYAVSPVSYSLTFSLTGLNASTASISGLFAADNAVSILLNGVVIGGYNNGTDQSAYSQLRAFSATSGFSAGQNVLLFQVSDLGVPSALMVSGLTGQAQAATPTVPEPATWGLMLLGFGAVGYAMRRRPGLATVAA